MGTAGYPRLVGDVGGTNARFGWIESAGGAPIDVATYATHAHPRLEDALMHYLAANGRGAPRWCAIGIANPVTGDDVRMTNHHWAFSISAMQREIGFERLVVINDFTALALSLPSLAAEDVQQVGAGRASPGAAIALIGPGTGLGVSGLLPVADGFVPITGEGGHATLAAADDEEADVIGRLRRRFGHVSAERALSGPGLENLHAALREAQPQPGEAMSAEAITAATDDPLCRRTVDLFLSLLGTAAGNLALTLGARGGVYIGGGIVPRLGDRIGASRFRERFEAKGRFREYLASIPTLVIKTSVSPALLGASRALDAL